MKPRRFTLAACALGPLVAFVSCSSSKDTPAQPADGGADATEDAGDRIVPPTPPEWDRPITRPDDATAKTKRGTCGFARGAMPAETLGASVPIDKDIPIETIVVIMQENRSFDHYFGHLNKFAKRTDIESAPDTASNPDTVAGGGTMHPWHHADHLCNSDTNHEWDGSHLEYDDGKNDGFVEANTKPGGEPGDRAMAWLDERDIPFYYNLANTFGIADHYHCSLLGPTWPNRMYLYGATSFGTADNFFPNLKDYGFPDGKDATVFDELQRRHVSWGVYSDGGPPGVGVLYSATGVNRWGKPAPIYGYMQDFLVQAAAGTLPQVVFLDAHIGAEGPAQNDEHPPADPQVGQKFMSDVVHALMKSPQWSKLALFITWDENGGFYDHLPPPAACPPDTSPPMGSNGPVPGAFDRLGFRVPMLVVSPYAKKGYVAHTTYDHSSITRFIETKFKLPALTARDANADIPIEMFDFQNPPYVTPPTIAEPTVDPTLLDYCATTYKK